MRAQNVINDVLRKQEPDTRIVGLVDPDEAGARQRLAECDRPDAVFYPTLDAMVRQAKLDGLFIGTRCNLHAPYAIEAARYDLPLYLEKPVAVSMEQAVGLERAFEKSRCPVLVSFPLRVSPLCVMARQHIAAGDVGQPVHITATNYVTYGTAYWEQGYRNYGITQGLFLQKATHDFDYMSFLMGEPIVRVAAMGTLGKVFGGTKPAGLVCSKCDEQETCLESPQNRQRHQTSGSTKDHPCVFSVDCGSPATGTNEDCSSAVVEFASGAHGIYTQVFFTRRDASTRGAIVSGYHGTLSFDWYTNQLRRVRHHEPVTKTETPTNAAQHFGGDVVLCRTFLGMLRGTVKQSETPITTGLQSVYACLAAKESMATGQFVNVRQVGSLAG